MPSTPIDDPDDPRIADFIGLRDRMLRTRARTVNPQPAVVLAEGDPVVARALRAGLTMRSILVDATRTHALPDGVPEDATVFRAGPEVLTRITGLAVHRGCLGLFDRPADRTVGDVLAGARRVLIGERLVNPVNLGVIVRSAAGLGIDALLLDPTSADPLYRRASRVSMGEVFDLPFARIGPLPDGLAVLAEAGFTLVGLTPSAEATAIRDLGFVAQDRVAILLGSEGPGLSDETMAACDRLARIPLAGRVDSLNVGVAAAIACYELGLPD